jgi:hypothetical protein
VARIAPSQIVQFIDRHLPQVREGAARNPTFTLDCGTHGALVRTLAMYLDALADELLIVTPEEAPDFMFAVGTLRQALVSWESDRSAACVRPPGLNEHPIGDIRHVLDHCPDEPLAAPSTKLAFIAQREPKLAEARLRDLGAVDRALANAEWKAATVLAGSVIEALLLHPRGVDHAQRLDDGLREFYRFRWRRFLVAVGLNLAGWLLAASRRSSSWILWGCMGRLGWPRSSRRFGRASDS